MMTPASIATRLRIIEQIPSWSMWWLEHPPSTQQRVLTAVEQLRLDIQKDRTSEVQAHG